MSGKGDFVSWKSAWSCLQYEWYKREEDSLNLQGLIDLCVQDYNTPKPTLYLIQREFGNPTSKKTAIESLYSARRHFREKPELRGWSMELFTARRVDRE